MDEITTAVSKYFNIGELIHKKSRKRNIVKARQIAIYAIRIKLDMPYQRIGDFFSLGHCSAIHSVKTVENDMESDSKFRKEVEEIMEIVSKLEIKEEKLVCNPSKF